MKRAHRCLLPTVYFRHTAWRTSLVLWLGLLPTLLGLLVTGCAGGRTMLVKVPLVDVRTQPNTTAQPNQHDPLEETQLVYGEQVRVFKTDGAWAQIEAVEQREFTHSNRWQGYPGWVPTAALSPAGTLRMPTVVVTEGWASAWEDAHGLKSSEWSFAMGTQLAAEDMGGQLWRVEVGDPATFVWLPRTAAVSLNGLQQLSVPLRRRAIVRNAEQLIGDPYYWGGRSPRQPLWHDQVTGVDCSGLVNLAYRAAGIEIPRDAHEQFLRASSVPHLQPGDLIFLSDRTDPRKIVHVMLYAGEGALIEAPQTGAAVRRISVKDRFGRSLEELTPGTVIEGQRVAFGSFLP